MRNGPIDGSPAVHAPKCHKKVVVGFSLGAYCPRQGWLRERGVAQKLIGFDELR